jgi:hypothetical protein
VDRSSFFYLLEPESDCGYVRWNFLDRHLDKGAIYPVSRITTKYTAVTRLID